MVRFGYLDRMLDGLTHSEPRGLTHQRRLPEPGFDVTSCHPSGITG